eukprot:gene21346-28281_t
MDGEGTYVTMCPPSRSWVATVKVEQAAEVEQVGRGGEKDKRPGFGSVSQSVLEPLGRVTLSGLNVLPGQYLPGPVPTRECHIEHASRSRQRQIISARPTERQRLREKLLTLYELIEPNNSYFLRTQMVDATFIDANGVQLECEIFHAAATEHPAQG